MHPACRTAEGLERLRKTGRAHFNLKSAAPFGIAMLAIGARTRVWHAWRVHDVRLSADLRIQV